MAKHLTLLVMLLAIIVAANATNWCSITCPDRYGNIYEHTMCTFKQDRPAPKCNQVVKKGLDQSEIAVIVDHHNQIRRSVANLPPLVWDATLATVAQRWANQCDYNNHDKCRNLEHETIGQNMAYKWKSGGDVPILDLMTGWVGERRFVNRNIIASFPRSAKGIGHYTQMVWAKTTKIGCGLVKFFERKFIEGKNWDGYSTFLVCNYGRSGNVLGEPVY